jgi:hypothetical protein
VSVVRTYLKSSDIISIENSSTILIGLLERKHEEAINIISNLSLEIKKLIKDNYSGYLVDTHFNLKKLATHKEAQEQFLALLSEKAAP